MRYFPESLSFWCSVEHLFKGISLAFFGGYEGQGMKLETKDEYAAISPNKCRINFVVPSQQILNIESAIFHKDASSAGILNTILESFLKSNPVKFVKLSIDGKKLAIGFGKMGDEDLCWYKKAPTLRERKEKKNIC